MAAKNVILALLALTSFAYGQTKALFADTNGTVQWGKTLRFDGPLDFTTNGFAATTRSNLSLGLPALTNTSNAGLLTALGGLATNGSAAGLTNFPAALLTTNGSAGGLTNFPALLLTTNSAASAFPAALLRTNGDGSGLTNLPNADLGSATGILPLTNGGTGSTNASAARTALELGTAATNDATAFQPANTNLTALAGGDGSSLTNVTITDASTLTNFPAELLRTNGNAAELTNFPASVLLTNGNAAGLTNFPAALLRTNGDGSGLSNVSVDLTTVLPAYSNNAAKVLAVASGETNVEWIAVSNTVTDASSLTNFPASILQTNSADGSFPSFLLRTNGNASGLTNFPTLNQNTTGTASNVTGVVAVANGGTGGTNATTALTNLLPSYSGNENRVLALNSNATSVIWTTNAGGGSSTVDLSTTNATGVLLVSKGGTGATNAAVAFTNLGVFASSDKTLLGEGAVTSNNESTAVGADARAYVIFGSAFGSEALITNANYATALGYGTVVSNAARGIALGAESTVTASNAVQIGIGTNSTANTVQFQSAGTISETEWGYLANASAQGGYAMTNTAGISGSKTFVAYDGTNYSTNTVTFSNGIITGWTP